MFRNCCNLSYVRGPRMLMCTTISQFTYQYLVIYSSLTYHISKNWRPILLCLYFWTFAQCVIEVKLEKTRKHFSAVAVKCISFIDQYTLASDANFRKNLDVDKDGTNFFRFFFLFTKPPCLLPKIPSLHHLKKEICRN